MHILPNEAGFLHQIPAHFRMRRKNDWDIATQKKENQKYVEIAHRQSRSNYAMCKDIYPNQLQTKQIGWNLHFLLNCKPASLANHRSSTGSEIQERFKKSVTA